MDANKVRERRRQKALRRSRANTEALQKVSKRRKNGEKQSSIPAPGEAEDSEA